MPNNPEIKKLISLYTPEEQNNLKTDESYDDDDYCSEEVDTGTIVNDVTSYYSLSTLNNGCGVKGCGCGLPRYTTENKKLGIFTKVLNGVKNGVRNQFVNLTQWTDSGDDVNKKVNFNVCSALLGEACCSKHQIQRLLNRSDSSRTVVSSKNQISLSGSRLKQNCSKCGMLNGYKINSMWQIAAAELYDCNKFQNKINKKQTSDKNVPQSIHEDKIKVIKNKGSDEGSDKGSDEGSRKQRRCSFDISQNIYYNQTSQMSCNKPYKNTTSNHIISNLWQEAADELCKDEYITNRSMNCRKKQIVTTRGMTHTDDECNVVTRDMDHRVSRRRTAINGNGNLIINNRLLINKQLTAKIKDLTKNNNRGFKERLMLPKKSNSCVDLNHATLNNRENCKRHRAPLEKELRAQIKRLRKVCVSEVDPVKKPGYNMESCDRERNSTMYSKRFEKCMSEQQGFNIHKYQQKINRRIMSNRECYRMKLQNTCSVRSSNYYYNSRIERLTANKTSKSDTEICKVVNKYKYSSFLSEYKQLMPGNGVVDDGVHGRLGSKARVETDECQKIFHYVSGSKDLNVDTTITCNPAFLKSFYRWNGDKKKKKSLKSKKSEETPRGGGAKSTSSDTQKEEGYGHLYPTGHKDVPVFLKGHHSQHTEVVEQPCEEIMDESASVTSLPPTPADSERSFVESVKSQPQSAKSLTKTVVKKEKKHKSQKPKVSKKPESTTKVTSDKEMVKQKSAILTPRNSLPNKLVPCAICNKVPGQCCCYLSEEPKEVEQRMDNEVPCNKFCKSCKSFKGSSPSKIHASKQKSDIWDEPKGFFCCCCNCSIKDMMRKMFCISLPSPNASETRFCFKRKKEYSPACTLIFDKNEMIKLMIVNININLG